MTDAAHPTREQAEHLVALLHTLALAADADPRTSPTWSDAYREAAELARDNLLGGVVGDIPALEGPTRVQIDNALGRMAEVRDAPSQCSAVREEVAEACIAIAREELIPDIEEDT